MGTIRKKTWFHQCFLLFLISEGQLAQFSEGFDTISSGQSLTGNQTLTSAGAIFEMGFFTPGSSRNYYIGIWYKSLPDQPVIWVANRMQPVSDPTFSVFKLLEDGNLVLLNQSGAAIWSSNSTSKVINSTTANLLDDGNFVVRNELESSSILWQSFDHPTDHWVPGSKLGYNKLTKEKQLLISWRSPENPATSLFSLELEQNPTSLLSLRNRSQQYWNSGEWTGKIFDLVAEIQTSPYLRNMTYVSNENESYLTYASAMPNAFIRFVLDASGQFKNFVWRNDNFNEWAQVWTRPTQQCEVYAFCGPFSICNQQKQPFCNCIQGFEPTVANDWDLEDHTDGCVRKAPLICNGGEKDKFLVLPNMRFPDNSEILAGKAIEECKSACLSNCSCNAFAYDNGCLIWKGNLFNLQQLVSDDTTGRDFHLRISATDQTLQVVKAKRNTAWIVFVAVAGFLTIFGLVMLILWRRRSSSIFVSFEEVDSLVLFKYRDLRNATRNFSEKLGEGGFGSVFKGILPDSTAIAVKQLKCLNSGEKQFRAEVKTIGMIRHINLVRLRGICVEVSKRFLVYEYMPNRSLESLLFRKSPKILDWQSRYRIAIGTARGLSYLHEECRDCIIHCDIKPENILLDAEYNPKLADFGLAKLVGRDFSRVLTTIRGTRGYLAPEWISGEAVSPKADVYSFGMLLFEVISGRRNTDPLEGGLFNNYFPFLVATTVFKGENVAALLDDRLEGSVNIEELTRACKVACWCIQVEEKDRPTMGQVVQILDGLSEVGIPPISRFLESLIE